MNIQIGKIWRQTGITSIELAILIGVLTLLTLKFVEFQAQQATERLENTNTRAVSLLSQAAMNFYIEQEGWPTNVTSLVPRFLGNFRNSNSDGNPYSFNQVTGGQALEITTSFASLRGARSLAIAWGPSAEVDTSTNTVTITIVRPGTEASHDPFFLVNGTRAIVGDTRFENGANLSMGDAAITDVREIDGRQDDGGGLIIGDTIDGTTISSDRFEYR